MSVLMLGRLRRAFGPQKMGGWVSAGREGWVSDWDCCWFGGTVNAVVQNEKKGVWRGEWSSGLTQGTGRNYAEGTDGGWTVWFVPGLVVKMGVSVP